LRQKSPAGNPKGKLAGDFLLPQILQTGYRFNGNGLSRLKNWNCDVKIGRKDKNRKVRLGEQKVDQKLHRRICSSVELFCLPTAWSENEKRMQNAVRLKNVRTGFL